MLVGMLQISVYAPGAVVLLILLGVLWFRGIQYPSALVWGSVLGDVGPVRAHNVLEYNKSLEDDDEPATWRARRLERSQQFKVNWGYLAVETKNATAFLQALRFERLKIKSNKPGLQYEPLETAIVALIEEATELRWQQVRWKFVLQFHAKLGLKTDKDMFNALLVSYKHLEEHVVALAHAEGQWLYDMLVERLGLTEWRVIEGGQAEPA